MSEYLNNPLQSRLTLKEAKREYLSKAVSCPTCRRSAKRLSWFYFASEGSWVTFCHRCDLQVDSFLERREYFSWEAVNISRDDQHLQDKHSLEQAKDEYLSKAIPCPKCKRTAEALAWFYFSSPTTTPKIAGWMTVCDYCMLQIDFFIEEQKYYETQKDYSWKQVKALRNNRDIQAQHAPEQAKVNYREWAKPCPRCNTVADQLSWFYFMVSEQSWAEFLTIGWLVVCNQCNVQTNFFKEMRLRQYAWTEVNKCRNDQDLQNQYPSQVAKRNYVKGYTTCPMCNTPVEQLSWFYFDSHPIPPGWMIVCDKCDIQIDLFRDESASASASYYSWQLVNAARNNTILQDQQAEAEAKERYGQKAEPCPQCKTPAKQLSWVLFISPKKDWRALAGRAGWMTVCDKCHIQVDFFVELLN